MGTQPAFDEALRSWYSGVRPSTTSRPEHTTKSPMRSGGSSRRRAAVSLLECFGHAGKVMSSADHRTGMITRVASVAFHREVDLRETSRGLRDAPRYGSVIGRMTRKPGPN
jgi:hypothetical protein